MRIERRRASHASSADKDKNDKIPVVRPLASTNKTRHRGPRSTSSKHRGVTQHRRTKKWEAHIWSERKQMYLGGHATEEGAARAHDIMALKCRGTESTLNYARHDYTFLGDKFDSLSKDDVRVKLLNKDPSLSSLTWSMCGTDDQVPAALQAQQNEIPSDAQLHLLHSPQANTAEGSLNMQQEMQRTELQPSEGLLNINDLDQDILFPSDADALSADNDSAVSDVCSLAESQFQDWSQPNTHAISGTASKALSSVAYSQLPHEIVSSPLFTTDNNPDSIFGYQLSTDLKYDGDTATDLLQQTLHMHVFNKPLQPAEAPCFNKSRLVSPSSSALGHKSRVEPDVYSKSGRLPHMSSPAHNSLLSNIISSLDIGDINKRPVTLLGRTRDSNAEAITESIGSPVLSSTRIARQGEASVRAHPSAWSGQLLNSRCTSTGQSHHTRRLLADLSKSSTATHSQGSWPATRQTSQLAYSTADQSPASRSPAGHLTPLTSPVRSGPGTVHDYAEPYSPLLLHSPRQPVFLTSFDLSGGYLPSQASPPYHSSIHSPTFSTYSQALSGTLGAHDALAQQRQLRAVLSGE